METEPFQGARAPTGHLTAPHMHVCVCVCNIGINQRRICARERVPGGAEVRDVRLERSG